MKNKIKNNSGITLIALMVTVVVMMIIAVISVYEGRELISKSRVETLETNMYSIQAKAKAYAEEIDAKVWTIKDKTKKEQKRAEEFNKKGLTRKGESDNYLVTNNGLEYMGLSDLKSEEHTYTVIYSNEYSDIDIEYSEKISYKGNQYTKLSELKNALAQN